MNKPTTSLDLVFCPSRFDTSNASLSTDFSRFRRLSDMVLWTEMTDALRRNRALRDDRITNWRTLHKLNRGDDENAISFLLKEWKMEGEHETPVVGIKYVSNRPPQRLSRANFVNQKTGFKFKAGVAHLPAHLEDDFKAGRSTPAINAHRVMLGNMVEEFCGGDMPGVLCFDGNLDWQNEMVRDYYQEAFDGTGFDCILPHRGRSHHTLGNRDVDLIWVRGLTPRHPPKVLLSTKSTDHRPQSVTLLAQSR